MKPLTYPASRSIALAALGAAIVLGLALWALGAPLRAHAVTYTPLTQQMGIGSTGGQVSELQTFLSLSHDVYPQAIASGYYGTLTSNAVTQFQVYYDLPAVGRVGPLTLAKLNAVIASGRGLDVNAPMINSAAVSAGNTGATVTWTTNENSSSRVFYDTNPIAINETAVNFTAPGISGSSVGDDVSMTTTHSVALSGLAPSTNYYYVVRSIDGSGNVSMTWPLLFRTSP